MGSSIYICLIRKTCQFQNIQLHLKYGGVTWFGLFTLDQQQRVGPWSQVAHDLFCLLAVHLSPWLCYSWCDLTESTGSVKAWSTSLPNRTASDIQVLGRHSSYNSPNGCVLVNLHRVKRFAENWRLIHIQHIDLYRCSILEGAHRMEAMIKMDVWGFYFKSVCLFCFKVQWLQ